MGYSYGKGYGHTWKSKKTVVSAPSTPAAPVNTVLPAITGTLTVGQTISTTTGTWTGSPTPSYAYQFKNTGANISGATSSTYLLQASDAGDLITVMVTATNASGSASATSASVGPIAGIVAVGGAALIVDETNAFAADFMHSVDAERIAVKTAGTVVSSGTSFITSSGTSSKWVYNAAGLLVNVAAGTLPIDYNQGFVVEQAATNVIFPSTPPSATAGMWTLRGTTTVTSGQTGPTGTTTAALIASLYTTASSDIYTIVSGLGASTRIEPSFFMKKAGANPNELLFVQNTYGDALGRWSINPALMGSGWEWLTRFHPAVTVTTEFVSDGSGNGGIHICKQLANSILSSFYVEMVKLETNTFSTSSIPTTSASVTRAADNPTFLLSTIPSLGSDYSIYCRFATPNIASARHVFVLTDGTTNEYVGFLTNTTARLAVVDGGSAVGAITGASLTANTVISLAARIKPNDCALSVGGSAVVTDTSVSLPTVTEVRFGGVGSNALATASYQIQKMVIVVPSWNNATLVTKSGS